MAVPSAITEQRLDHAVVSNVPAAFANVAYQRLNQCTGVGQDVIRVEQGADDGIGETVIASPQFVAIDHFGGKAVAVEHVGIRGRRIQ